MSAICEVKLQPLHPIPEQQSFQVVEMDIELPLMDAGNNDALVFQVHGLPDG